MSNRLSNYAGNKYTFTIGEIAARGNLADELPTLTFNQGGTFMDADEIGDILADFTKRLYISMVPASGNLESDFITTLLKFWNLREPYYHKMYIGITKNYDPINNYDMQEETLSGRKVDNMTDTNTRTGSMTETETPTGTTTTTTTPTGGTKITETPTGTETVERTEEGSKTTTETESRTTYDDPSTFEDAVQTVTTVTPDEFVETSTTSFDQRKTETTEEYVQNTKTTVTETFTNRQTSTTTQYNQLADTRQINNSNTMTGAGAGGSVTGMHEVEETFHTRSGNIGVTTSQQMLTSEIELRSMYDLKFMFMREFLTRYTF